MDEPIKVCAWRAAPMSFKGKATPVRMVVKPGNHCVEDGWRRFTFDLEIVNPETKERQ